MDIKYFVYLSNVGEIIVEIMNKLAILASLSKYFFKFGHASLKQFIDLILVFTLSRSVCRVSTDPL